MTDGKVYMTDRSGRQFCIDNVHHVTVTEAETKNEGTIRTLTGSFEATIEAKIDFHTMHILTGTESNNERRRHHEPMRRRRKIVYIRGVSLGKWRAKKILNTLRRSGTHDKRRGNTAIN